MVVAFFHLPFIFRTVIYRMEDGDCIMRVLVIEDDRRIAETIAKNLKAESFAVDIARDGESGEETAKINEYDVIILDLSDPVGPAYELFQKEFHQKVFDHLKDDGILVAQAESPYFNKQALKAMYTNLNDIFPLVKLYTGFMPIYPSGLWGFAFCSKRYDPLKDFDEARWEELSLKTRYYNNDIHKAAFALPQFMRNYLG